MKTLKNLFILYKNHIKEVQLIKIIALVIINTWLLIIFWKILLVDNVFIGNNMALTKMNTVIQPVLMYLGIDMLSPSVLKMIIITTIILGANIMVLNFESIILMIIPLGLARYGYKSYTNYLINSENIVNTAVQQQIEPIITQKVMKQAPIIINTVTESGTNWWLWGTVIAVGIIAVVGVGIAIWSHQSNASNIVNTSQANYNFSKSLNEKIDIVGQHTSVIDKQVDLIFKNQSRIVQSLENKDQLLNEKITNLEGGFQEFGSKITILEEKNLENVKLLSEETLKITREAKNFFGEVLDSNTATEGLILSIAKLYDGFTLLEDRVNTTEAKIESITGGATQSPRNIFTRNVPNLAKVINKNDE